MQPIYLVIRNRTLAGVLAVDAVPKLVPSSYKLLLNGSEDTLSYFPI
ncbi:hypothetical protein [Exiguobacterium indicum]|nr:hypothetical protein [Exiguobacterium indicum]